MPKTYATFDYELELLKRYSYIVSLDEVGRGAIAGPVVVVASIVSMESFPTMPKNLADSKLIRESQRLEFSNIAKEWVHSYGIGAVGGSEVDSKGIIPALRSAGEQAVQKALAGFSSALEGKSIVLLDGSHNWLSDSKLVPFFTITKTKADRDCASVSASSIIAKVYRDDIMLNLAAEHPAYGWDSNKGYGAASHYEAIQNFGLVEGIHRKTWIKK
jgi:ribonuclease HII